LHKKENLEYPLKMGYISHDTRTPFISTQRLKFEFNSKIKRYFTTELP